MRKEKEPKLPLEPPERTAHRATCKHCGYCGNCYKHSGYTQIGGGVAHITMACSGDCRRMQIWDTQHGYKGVKFKLREI